MARVTYGAIITDIKGSIGGITFQRNRAGAIARLRGGNPKAKTTKQSSSMAEFSLIATQWKSVSLANRVLWNDYGIANPKIDKHGALKILTGYNMFQSLNFWRNKLALPFLVVPPAYVVPPPIVDYTINLTPTQILLENMSFPAGASLYWIPYASPPVFTSTKSNFNRMLFAGVAPPALVFPFDFTPFWEALTGLNYIALRSTSQFNIASMFNVVDINSGITSVGLFKTWSF